VDSFEKNYREKKTLAPWGGREQQEEGLTRIKGKGVFKG
jgi:hypothetical protein